MGTLKIIDDHEVCDQELRAANKRADKAEVEVAALEKHVQRAIDDYNFWYKKATTAKERADKAEQDRNQWHDKAQEYRQQSAEYRDSRDKWCEAAVREQLATKDTLPRVITADELREGQVVAIHETDFRIVTSGTVIRVEDGGEVVRLKGHGATILGLNRSNVDEIVLLADAQEEKPNFGPGGKVEYLAPKPDCPDNPWFATVYEDAAYWAGTWRGTPVTPQSIRAGDLYDIHTEHGTTITGVLAGRDGVHRPQNGDHYRLVKEGAA